MTSSQSLMKSSYNDTNPQTEILVIGASHRKNRNSDIQLQYVLQGTVFISPTHNDNITSRMKAFIDRLYCFYTFVNTVPRNWSRALSGQNHKTVIGEICERENKKDMGFTLEAMRLPTEALRYEIVDELAILKVFKRGGVKKDVEVLNQSIEAGEKLAISLS